MLRRKQVLTALLLFVFLSSALHAQIRSATITGSVRDATDAAIPNAEVTIRNQETNISAAMRTNDSGQ